MFISDQMTQVNGSERSTIGGRQLFFINNYMWSTTKKISFVKQIVETKCENLKLSPPDRTLPLKYSHSIDCTIY